MRFRLSNITLDSLIFILISILLGFFLVKMAHAQTVVEGEFVPTNVCYTNEDGNVTSEVFNAPVIIPDTGVVQFIDVSPIDPGRSFDELPNFGLAKWHWWLFSQSLFRAQRQYAGCVERIKQSQRLLGMSPLIDDPGHGLHDIINAVREYEIPFDPVQNTSDESLPPTKQNAIAHVKAAVNTTNLTVFHLGLCETTASWLEGIVKSKMKK